MKKQSVTEDKKSNGNQSVSSQNPVVEYTNAFLLKGMALAKLTQDMFNKEKSVERKFRTVKELEQIILKNSRMLFGERTFLVLPEKKGEALFAKDFAPHALLLDLGNIVKPRFYFLNVSISGQEFYSRIFPKIIRFLSYFKNKELMEKIGGLVINHKYLQTELKEKISKEGIAELVKTAISKPFILMLSDSPINEFIEAMTVYAEMEQTVKSIVIRKFASNGATICTIAPLFSDLHLNGKKRVPNAPSSEEDHLKEVSDEVKAVYNKIKTELLKVNSQLQFNPQKYYISMRKDRNRAFFHFSRKRITLVVMNPEKETRKQIKKHEVKTLTEKVQKFWNGPSCSIVIESVSNLQEVIILLKKLITA